ncbi:hypothetical protein MBM_04596 [Drepanopeziza brunnea f. sp. 'multigermtubi' MB_m1]|uniref:Uncharacterized protein n=1 Tax=Marssonina brunnea f. sp. multigermtubi (strain MB_m1) TaxID=1072389 RepID=K1XW87_MARBU|nr:uncharacterized protein MBM_04596 [Drepanopeziza brunnea f. sp. 'multigermtubi' MB_m1]EKD17019.1 hypothetical protein MBM_04596 [Drepanopeziza brunnea f. sp. 'multigermtubi' MB_m1]
MPNPYLIPKAQGVCLSTSLVTRLLDFTKDLWAAAPYCSSRYSASRSSSIPRFSGNPRRSTGKRRHFRDRQPHILTLLDVWREKSQSRTRDVLISNNRVCLRFEDAGNAGSNPAEGTTQPLFLVSRSASLCLLAADDRHPDVHIDWMNTESTTIVPPNIRHHHEANGRYDPQKALSVRTPLSRREPTAAATLVCAAGSLAKPGNTANARFIKCPPKSPHASFALLKLVIHPRLALAAPPLDPNPTHPNSSHPTPPSLQTSPGAYSHAIPPFRPVPQSYREVPASELERPFPPAAAIPPHQARGEREAPHKIDKANVYETNHEEKKIPTPPIVDYQHTREAFELASPFPRPPPPPPPHTLSIAMEER